MSGLYQSRKMEARLSTRLELPWVLSLNAELVETHHPFVVGQRYHRFSAPLRRANLDDGRGQRAISRVEGGSGTWALCFEFRRSWCGTCIWAWQRSRCGYLTCGKWERADLHLNLFWIFQELSDFQDFTLKSLVIFYSQLFINTFLLSPVCFTYWWK